MALQAQINPHFLYNTLRSIRWMADVQGADNVTGAIDDLIQLFRLTTQIQGEYITIEEDLHIIRLYCEILMIRYMDCFTVEYEVDETCCPVRQLNFCCSRCWRMRFTMAFRTGKECADPHFGQGRGGGRGI